MWCSFASISVLAFVGGDFACRAPREFVDQVVAFVMVSFAIAVRIEMAALEHWRDGSYGHTGNYVFTGECIV